MTSVSRESSEPFPFDSCGKLEHKKRKSRKSQMITSPFRFGNYTEIRDTKTVSVPHSEFLLRVFKNCCRVSKHTHAHKFVCKETAL